LRGEIQPSVCGIDNVILLCLHCNDILPFDAQVPTMIVYGERDKGAPVDTLRQMPNSKVFMMKDAGHACYMNDNKEWHRLLFNFLRSTPVFGNWTRLVVPRWKWDLIGALH